MPETLVRQWLQQVLDEHRELNELVGDLRAYLEVPRPGIGDQGFHSWSSKLSRRLVRLHDKLFRHFRFEEEDGMIEELTTRHPRAVGRLDELVEDHRAMLATVRRLTAATLEYAEGSEPADPTLRRQIVALLDQLHDHERAETDLIQRLEYEDLGTGD